MLNPEEAKATIQFLDRTPITGHGERQAMNQIISKLAPMTQPAPPEEKPADEKPTRKTSAKKDA